MRLPGRIAIGMLVGVVTLGALSLTTTRPAAADPSLTLTAQTPWILPGGTVDIDLAILDVPLDAFVTVSIHSALTSRSAFDLSLDQEALGASIYDVEVPVGFLGEVASSERRLSLRFEDPVAPSDGAVPVTGAGVYPTIVTLDVDGDADPTFVTYIVIVEGGDTGPSVGEPLGLSWVWPLDADPVISEEGQPDPVALAELEPDGRVGRQLDALATYNLESTLVAGGWTVQQIASVDATSQRLLAPLVSGTNQVLSSGYVPQNLPSLLAHGLGDAVREGRRQGIAATESALGTRLDTRTALAVPVDPTAFGFLAGSNVDRMVVDEADLTPLGNDRTPAHPFRLASGDQSVLAAAPDPGLIDLLASPGPPALRAQQLVGGLSLIAYESPALTRGVVLVNPLRWDPSEEFLDAALGAITGNPLLDPMTLDRFFESVPIDSGGGTDVERTLEARSPQPPPVNADAYHDMARRQTSFRTLVGPTSDALLVGDNILDVVLSATWGPNSSAASSQLGIVNTTIEEFLARIRVPVDRSITLTAHSGTIPIQFLNETGQEVNVVVNLESERLDFPDGTTHDIVLPPRSSTQQFDVETRTSGRFPLVLNVTSPDGALAISSARMDVRSTAVSGVGIFLTVGAAVVLAGWWGNDIRKRRRGRGRTITPAGGPDGGE